MARAARLIACSVLILATTALEIRADDGVEAIQNRLVLLYQQHQDAVVKVKVATRTEKDNGEEQVALTVLSGFFIDEEGTVLTNAVPTQQGPRLRVEKNGAQLLAVAIGSDPISNIALLRLAKPPENISFIDLEKASEPPAVGAIAYAISSPLDFSPTPRMGLVGGQESSFGKIEFPFTYTRVGIPSGPAEGGSPVFNFQGQLIGISVATLPEIDSSYIVPTAALRTIVSQLRENQSVTHPAIRATFAERGSPIELSRQIIVSGIERDSAAEKSGLQSGDRILSFQGASITSVNQLKDAIFFSEPQSFVTLTVQRDDVQRDIPVLLETRRP